ncbi:DUF456 domain-containing protein [Lysobacter fragariae]
MDLQAIYYVLAVVMMVLGIVGTVLPALPGLPLVFAGMLLAAWAGDFQQVGGWVIAVLAVLTLVSLGIDFMATMLGAKRVGASKVALVGAMLGTFAGLLFGVVGIFVGPFIGALVGELIWLKGVGGQELGKATKVGLGTWMGIVVGTILKLGVAFVMVGLFVLAWLV